MSLLNPSAVVNAMLTRVGAIKVGAGMQSAGETMFTRPRFYELDDIAEALERLVVVENRVAIVVLETIQLEWEQSGTDWKIEQDLHFTLMFADRNWANRTEALLGGALNPGALSMIPAIAAGLFGQTSDGFVVRPGKEEGRLMLLTGSEGSNNYSRACYRLPFSVQGGILKGQLRRGTRN